MQVPGKRLLSARERLLQASVPPKDEYPLYHVSNIVMSGHYIKDGTTGRHIDLHAITRDIPAAKFCGSFEGVTIRCTGNISVVVTRNGKFTTVKVESELMGVYACQLCRLFIEQIPMVYVDPATGKAAVSTLENRLGIYEFATRNVVSNLYVGSPIDLYKMSVAFNQPLDKKDKAFPGIAVPVPVLHPVTKQPIKLQCRFQRKGSVGIVGSPDIPTTNVVCFAVRKWVRERFRDDPATHNGERTEKKKQRVAGTGGFQGFYANTRLLETERMRKRDARKRKLALRRESNKHVKRAKLMLQPIFDREASLDLSLLAKCALRGQDHNVRFFLRLGYDPSLPDSEGATVIDRLANVPGEQFARIRDIILSHQNTTS